jgi:hypothetical protein
MAVTLDGIANEQQMEVSSLDRARQSMYIAGTAALTLTPRPPRATAKWAEDLVDADFDDQVQR